LRNSALVRFEVTANYLFSKYRLQALIFKIPASAKLVVKYRPSGNPTPVLPSRNPAQLHIQLAARREFML